MGERGARPRKGLGQSFLLDPNFLDAIARSAEVGPREPVIEIGAGLGTLTERLAERARHVWSFEIDPLVFGIASDYLRPRANVTLLNVDGAEFARHLPAAEAGPFKLVSNMPYSDYQRLLLSALSAPRAIEGWYLMLQSDVVRKLAAGPGDAGYGPLAAIVGGLFEFKSLRRAGRALFWPAPRVDSEFFRLRRRVEAPFDLSEIPRLERGLRALFAGRRKQLKAVAKRLPAAVLERFPEHSARRVESLDPATLLGMADIVKPRNGTAGGDVK